MLPTGLLHRPQLRQHVRPAAILHPAQIDHQVDLAGSVSHGVLSLEHLHRCGGVAIGKPDDGTHRKFSRQILAGLFDIAGRDAHRGAAIGHPVVANLANLLPGGGRAQQGVVHRRQDAPFVQFSHLPHGFISSPSYPPFCPIARGFPLSLNHWLNLLKISSIALNRHFSYNTTIKRMEEFP